MRDTDIPAAESRGSPGKSGSGAGRCGLRPRIYSYLFNTKGQIPRAIAMDINQGPLLRAREHIRDGDWMTT